MNIKLFADIIPIITGSLIFAAVLLGGRRITLSRRRLGWVFGGVAQLLLCLFGWLTGHLTFNFHLPIAVAFIFNIAYSYVPVKDSSD